MYISDFTLKQHKTT